MRHVVSNTNVTIGSFALNFSHQQFIRSKEEIKVIKKSVLKQKEIFLFWWRLRQQASVPARIVLLNRIVHLNTVNRIVRNWTITSFKIQHSPDFRKQRCGERTIWFDPCYLFKQFSTVFFKGQNSWIQLLFHFFLEHRLKTLNKEECNLTHVIKNTHGLAYVAFSNISSRLWSGDNTIWRILSIKEIYQVFI